MLQLVIAAAALFPPVTAENCSSYLKCQDCAGPCRWCLSMLTCVMSMYSCHPKNTVEDAYNCPTETLPSYNDSFVRRQVLHFIAAANAVNNSHTGNDRAAWQCVAKLASDVSIQYTLETACNYGWDRCAALVAVDLDLQMIVVGFRTSTSYSSMQFVHQFVHFLLSKIVHLADSGGSILAYYHSTFWDLFNGGLGAKIKDLLVQYPRYDFMLVGHSLGGAQATVAAYYFQRFFPAQRVSLFTFSSPRVGDVIFASSIEKFQGIASFRIVRNRDWIPDMPFRISEKVRLHHSRHEVLYPSTAPGEQPQICRQAEDNTCSRAAWLKNPFAHIRIFQNLHTWYEDGCSRDTGI